MPTGTPLTLKCPKCRRGKNRPDPGRPDFGYQPIVKGMESLKEFRTRYLQRGRRLGKKNVHEGKVKCLDCGHVWWSSIAPGVSTYARALWEETRRRIEDLRK